MGNSVFFLDKNSERNMYVKRITRLIDVLRSDYLCTGSVEVNGFRFRDGRYTIEQIDEGEWRDFDSEKDLWGYRECYAWFRHSFEIPAEFAGKPVLYEIMPSQKEWRGGGTQFIVFANGKLLQGVDSNHNSVSLLNRAKGGESFDVCINAYTDDWDFGGKMMMRARIKTYDELVMKLIFDLLTPLEVANLYETDDLPRINIVKSLNDAVNLLDLSTPDRAAFAASAEAAIALLDREIYGRDTLGVKTSCIGHTHIDVAWLWRLLQTRDKTGRSFATVLKLMEEYPEYKFMSSQAQLYDYCKQDYPQVYEGIKRRVAEGRWEPEGSMWVEADTNVTSGESLVRQFLVGKRFFKDEFGVDNKIMWLPDVFGYSAALPQIMKRAGIDYFMTTKISWNEYNKVPYDTFMWKGIDGTEVLSHFEPSTDHDERKDFGTTYNAYLEPELILGGWRRYSQKDLNRNVLCSFGFGDGGGGPTVEMLEYGRRMERGIEGCPVTKMEFSRGFFDNLKKDVEGSRRLPTWSGELYLEFHRGTLTSQARNKRYNRKSEILYHDVETLAAMAQTLCGSQYPSAEIYEAWKIILLNQFHDIIPGSSIQRVYEEAEASFSKVQEVAGAEARSAAEALVRSGEGLTVFNSLSWPRSVVVPLPTGWQGAVNARGDSLPVQTSGGALCAEIEAPACGWTSLQPGAPAQPANTLRAEPTLLENDLVRITLNARGEFTSIWDKEAERDWAAGGANILRMFQDIPSAWDAWDIDSIYRLTPVPLTEDADIRVTASGPLYAELTVTRRLHDSPMTQQIRLYRGSRRVECHTVVEWRETHKLLKVAFPVTVYANEALHEIQYGHIRRPAHRSMPYDADRFEVSNYRWTALTEEGRGCAVLNDCKYGVDVLGDTISLTLLRSPLAPDMCADRGRQEFTYGFTAWNGPFATSPLVREAYALNVPPLTVPGRAVERSLFAVDAENIVVDTVKCAEDGSGDVVVRLVETKRTATRCRLTTTLPVGEVIQTDMLENSLAPLASAGGQVTLEFRPFEVKTLRLRAPQA